MDLSTVWWLVTGGLIALELITGTFYLLMLSVGAAASALAAHADLSLTWQIVVGAIVGGLSVTLWHMKKKHAHISRRSLRGIKMCIWIWAKSFRCWFGMNKDLHKSSTAARSGLHNSHPGKCQALGLTGSPKWRVTA